MFNGTTASLIISKRCQEKFTRTGKNLHHVSFYEKKDIRHRKRSLQRETYNNNKK